MVHGLLSLQCKDNLTAAADDVPAVWLTLCAECPGGMPLAGSR